MKDMKKYKLDVEALKNVSGGARDTFDPEHFQEYWNEKVSENDITKVPDLDNPHSKKAKGKLYKQNEAYAYCLRLIKEETQ